MWGNGLTAQLVWTGNSNPTVGFRAIIEWSADCNSDGIVDYGQIRAGELEDANGNNIPDCCEQSTSCPINLIENGGFEIGPTQTDCT